VSGTTGTTDTTAFSPGLLQRRVGTELVSAFYPLTNDCDGEENV
jgi:hypothetical protein